jgi:hypothetical protein
MMIGCLGMLRDAGACGKGRDRKYSWVTRNILLSASGCRLGVAGHAAAGDPRDNSFVQQGSDRLNGHHLIQQIRCTLFLEQHADRMYTQEEILTYCGSCTNTVSHILEDLCRKNILEKFQADQQVFYRYITPKSELFQAEMITNEC